MSTPTRTREWASGISVLDKASTLLEIVEQAPTPLNELVARSGLARPTAYRIAMALQRLGLLTRDSRKRFVLGPRLGTMSVEARQDRLAQEAVPVLAELHALTGLDARVLRRSGRAQLCVATSDDAPDLHHGAGLHDAPDPDDDPAPDPDDEAGLRDRADARRENAVLRADAARRADAVPRVARTGADRADRSDRADRADRAPVGTARPLTGGAVALVLLAWEEPEEIFAGLRGARFTAAHLSQVRRRGWARGADAMVPGEVAYAVPVRIGAGRVVAALSVSGEPGRMDPIAFRRFGASVFDAANRLGDLLQQGRPAALRD